MGFFSKDKNKVLRINPGYTGSSFGEITKIASNSYSVGTLTNGKLRDVVLNLNPTLIGATGYIIITFSVITTSGTRADNINAYLYPEYGKTFSGNYTVLTQYNEGININISDDLSTLTLYGTQQKTLNNFLITGITANIVKENNGTFSTMYFGDGNGREKKVKGMYYSFGNGKFVDLFNPRSTIAPTTVSPTTTTTTVSPTTTTTTTTTTTQYVPPVYPIPYTVSYLVNCTKTVSWISSIPKRAGGYYVGEYLGTESLPNAISVSATKGIRSSWPISYASGGHQVFNNKGEHSYTYRYDGSGTLYWDGETFYMVGGSVTNIL